MDLQNASACDMWCSSMNDIKEVLYTQDQIATRVAELGQQITSDYRELVEHENTCKQPQLLVISVLRGAAIYMSDLVRHITLPLEMDYMAVSSYGCAATTCGVVSILKDLSSDIEGRHVLIAEDILDSGLTLNCLLKELASRNPASIEVAALLSKNTTRKAEVDCKYVGFECPDEFIVGYGLDYAERYRNLPFIGVLKPEVYQG